MLQVRELTDCDAAAFQALFLRALREYPEAFGIAAHEQEAIPLENVARQLANPDSRTFGAWQDDALIGIATLNRFPRAKTRHRAMVTGMYVVSEARGQGIGRALLDAALAHARAWPDLDHLVLAVTVGNEAARNLYITAGFTPYSIDARYIKVDDRYFDIEWMMRMANHG